MKKDLLSIKIAAVLLIFSTSLYAQNGLVGWANYNDLGQNGTTGGGNGTIVRVTSRAELENYAKAAEPYTILVEGSFTGIGTVDIASDKTIIGAGGGATFDGIGFNVNNKKNIIIRNITIKNGSIDAIAIRNTHHVWVDHCDLSASGDGLLDFTIGSDYLTVSWTKFHHHDKVALVNSGTQHFEDVGKNKITYHHNWFYNTAQRNPRIGYGMGHVYNNYYTDISLYCVGYHTGASVLVENNYFLNSSSPLNQMYETNPVKGNYADAKEVGNIFDNTTGNTTGTGVSFDPEFYYNYKFALDSAKDVPSLVDSLAGPIFGIEYELLPIPGNGAIDVHTAGDTLYWTNLDSVTSWEVYFGTSTGSLTMTSTGERSFSPDTLKPDTVYFWKVNAIKSDTTLEGSLWKFRTAPAKASKPYPVDGELHAKLRQPSSEITCSPLELKWIPGFRASKYKVYFGETEPLSESDYMGEVTSPTFAPGPLTYGVKYYWSVTTISNDDSVTEGDTWNFISDVTYSQEGDTEMEDMVLNGRAFLEPQNGSWFPASNNMVVSGEAGPGTMSSIWAGPDSTYTISVSYFDESDGKGWYGFYVNEDKIDEWFASKNNDEIIIHTIDNVHILTDYELRIAFYTNDGELNRTDLMSIKVFEEIPQDVFSMGTPNYPANQEMTVSIYSISGRLLKSYIVMSDENGMVSQLRLNDQHLPSGIYIYTIHGNNIPIRKAKLFMRK